MFISHQYRVIFVHIQRTGGYSIHDIFRQYDPDLIESVPIDPAKQRVRHCYISDIRAAVDADTFNDYHKFCVVRHPYERMRSWYQVLRKGYDPKNEPRMQANSLYLQVYQRGIHYLNRHPHRWHAHLAGYWTGLFRLFGRNNTPSALSLRSENTGNRVLVEVNRHAGNFAEFLHLPRDQAHGLFERFYANQFDYIAENDAIAVDDVLRFEQLEADFAAFAKQINFPGRLPHLNQSKTIAKGDTQLDAASKQLICTRFAQDFAYFHYSRDF